MIILNQVPNLKIYRMKSILPIDLNNKLFGSCILLNTNSISTDIKLMNHKMFDNTKFTSFYMDPMYIGKIHTYMYRENKKRERLEIYESIKNDQSSRRLSTYLTESQVNNRNVYYDMHVYNNIFFNMTKEMEYKRRIVLYLEFIKKVMYSDFVNSYKNKTMFIDLNEWDSVIDKSSGSKNFNNPITILYYAMRRMFSEFKALGDMDIVFISNDNILKINPSSMDDKSFNIFKQEIRKINRIIIPEEDGDTGLDPAVVSAISGNFIDKFNLVGDNDELYEKVKDKVSDINKEDISEDHPDSINDTVTKSIEEDVELMKEIDTIVKTNVSGRTTASLKRDDELRKKQSELIVGGMKLSEVYTKNIPQLESNSISSHIQSTNPNMQEFRYPDFEKSYNENLYKKDILNIFTDLSENSLAMFIVSIDIEDSSDELNLKETWTIKLEDSNRQRHTIKVDIPKFIDDKFLYLGGNKKIIIKQQIMKPIVKTNPDTVQIVTNYNKMFVRRVGDKVSNSVEQLKKYISTHKMVDISIKNGDSSKINSNYKTALEYDYLSKSYSEIKTTKHVFMFNQDNIKDFLKLKKISTDLPKGCWMIVGMSGNTPLYLTDEQLIYGTDKELIEFILDSMETSQKGIKEEILDTSGGKRFMYSRAKSMNREIPLILLISFFEGLSTILRSANVPHYFTDKNPKAILSNRQDVIRFNNGYLVFDKYPIENSLLMYGLSAVNTKAYDYEEFDDRETFLTIFEDMYGARSLGRYFLNVYESMIDHTTKEVLEYLGYPTKLCDVLIYANSLLSDNSYMSEVNMNLYRIRSNEIVSAILYKIIADEYNNYRNIALVSKNRKMSIKQDAVIKELLMSQIVEDYSILNPIVELEKSRAVTPKGPSGLNLSRAYTQEKRSYDKSMMGIMAISTSPDANCGVVRSLALEPFIRNGRGFIDVHDDDLKKLKDVNLFSPGEMLTPLGGAGDDAIRTAMATKQSKHIIPVKNASPVLISNGAEQSIHYHLSNDFSVAALQDGEVVEVDEKNELVIVKYKDGTNKAIDISTQMVKNGAGGFYLPNTLKSDLRKGQKFKKNDILAYHDQFFTDDINGNRFNIGALAKVAIYSTGETYEDSAFITHKLGEDLSSEIVMKKPVVLEKNATIDNIVVVGQKIKVGDELIRFETSYEEDYLNTLLSDIGDDLKEEIKSYGKKPIKSKYSGEIVDIQIFHTVELDDLSPTLKKLVSAHNNEVDKKKKVVDKYKNDGDSGIYKCGILMNQPSGKLTPKDGKIHGEYVGEGVLIEFYIKYHDVAGIGDKFANFTALKSIVGNVIPEGEEPFSLYRPDEEISTFIPPGAIVARMTPSVIITLFGNKVLVELKRKLQDIYDK